MMCQSIRIKLELARMVLIAIFSFELRLVRSSTSSQKKNTFSIPEFGGNLAAQLGSIPYIYEQNIVRRCTDSKRFSRFFRPLKMQFVAHKKNCF